MRRLSSRLLWSLILVIGPLASWPSGTALGQDLALDSRRPRFLYAPSLGSKPVQIDAGRNVMLRRVVSLTLDRPTVADLLAAIERRTGVRFLYDANRLPGDRIVPLRAESITIAGALTEILLGTGLDVVVSAGNRVAFMEMTSQSAGIQGGVVVGRVVDVKMGDGLGGVDVSLEGTRWRTVTGEDGRYRLADVTPGSYTLVARRIGYGPQRRAVTVTVGQETAVDVVALQPAATRLGDVIVTSQKREERLQDVPLSVAVVTPEEIDRRGLVNAEDYLRGMPGVNLVEGGVNGHSIVIRGLETSGCCQNSTTGGSPVATYFGETPTTLSGGLSGGTNVDAKLADIERVEVLRGPQGTAFGSASMSGTVRTIPVAPKLDRVEGKLATGYSQTAGTGGDNYEVQGVLNLPLIKDRLALRATGYWYEESGFYRNVTGSEPYRSSAAARGAEAFALHEEEIGTTNSAGGRIAALFQASEALKFTVSYLRQASEVDGWAAANVGPFEQAVLAVPPEHAIRGNKGAFRYTHLDIANAVVEYDLGWANLLATYSYVEGGTDRAQSLGSTGGVVMNPWSLLSLSEHRGHIGEIRLATQLDGAWNFLAGVYAEDLDDEVSGDNVWYGTPASNIFAPGQTGHFSESRGRNNLQQKAAFGEASWEFLPGLTLTGGARVYDYERSQRTASSGVFGGDGTFTPLASDATGATFRGNLSYKPTDNALLYGGWSQGFRLGRPQLGLTTPGVCDLDGNGIVDGTSIRTEDTREIESDEIDNYELGGKFTLLDRRLVLTADVYRMDWSNLPFLQVFLSCNGFYTENAGAARSEGIEFQANFYVTDAFRVDVGGSRVRARLTTDVPTVSAFAGNRLLGAPKFNANLGLQYEFGLGGSQAFVRTDAIYVGSYYGNLQNAPDALGGDYVKVDASARVALRYLDVGLFVRNLTNADEFTLHGRLQFFGWRLRPRTVGLRLSRTF